MLRRAFFIALVSTAFATLACAQFPRLAQGEPPTLRLVYTGAVGGQLGPCG